MRVLHCLTLLIVCVILYSCVPSRRDVPDAPAPDARLQAKYDAYVALQGAYPEDDCDWLLFASLIDSAGGLPADPERARDAKGLWYRTPAQDCYPERSGSTISRDMFVGLFWWIWQHKRVDVAEQIFDYGLEHTFKMGKGPLSRVYMTENLQFTLALITQRLGGKDYTVWKFPIVYPGGLTGFEAHLQACLIALRALLDDANDSNATAAAELAERYPENALFHAVNGIFTGDQTRATELLLDERWWPADRLPTSAERCSPWVTQRDPGPSWEPCPDEALTHSGGDFLFAAAIALGRFHDN